MNQKVVAIDFDGTIAESVYPDFGELLPGAKEYINKLYEDGIYIIIYTCRSGKQEAMVSDFLSQHGVKFHLINQNKPELVEFYNIDSRKVSADIYVDDKQLGGLPKDWSVIYEMIHHQLKSGT